MGSYYPIPFLILPPGRTAKLRNDILMFQKRHGESLSEAWTRFKDLLQKVPHHGIDLWLQVQIFMTMSIPSQDEPLTNRPLNEPMDFAKSVKAIALPQDVLITSDRCLIDLETQVQRLMEAHLALTQPTHVNKITTSCKICSGPYDTQYCMENLEQAFVDYASSCIDKGGGKWYTFNPEQNNLGDTYNPSWRSHPNLSLQQLEIKTEAPQPEEPEPTLKDKFQDLHLNLPVLEVLAHAPIYNAILDKYVESLELGKNKSAFVQGEIPTKIEDPGLITLPGRLWSSKPFDTFADLGSCVNIIPLYLLKKLNIGLLEETDHIFGLADGTKSNLSVFGVKGVDLGEEEALYWTTHEKRESYKPRPRSERVATQTHYYARKDFLDCHLPGEWEISIDAELNPFKDTLVFRRMVEYLGAIPIKLKCNMWESEDLIKKPIN
nr:MAK10-like protein [Tanacetum cinerariifolium]